jgi:hypothetical protein
MQMIQQIRRLNSMGPPDTCFDAALFSCPKANDLSAFLYLEKRKPPVVNASLNAADGSYHSRSAYRPSAFTGADMPATICHSPSAFRCQVCRMRVCSVVSLPYLSNQVAWER